jgi:hypothetical protein
MNESFDAIIFYCNRKRPKLVAEAKWLKKLIKEKTQAEVFLAMTSGPDELRKRLSDFEKYERPLIVSVGGDGSFNLLINVLPNINLDPVVAVYPAGTANDNARVTGYRKEKIVEGILAGKTRRIDLIEIRITGKTAKTYYAHSYFGIGVTGHTAKAINEHHGDLYQQVVIALGAILKFKPVLVHGEKVSHISWHSISEMCRFCKVSKISRDDDGLLEMVKIKASLLNRPKLIYTFIKSFSIGLDSKERVKESHLAIPHETWSQFDGEELLLPAQSDIIVRAMNAQLEVLAY